MYRQEAGKGALRAWAQKSQEWTTASTGQRAGLCMSAATTIIGNCILLDNGELAYVCRVSAIPFIAAGSTAVLPLDGQLEAALLHRADRKRCTECGGYFLPSQTGEILPGLRRTHERIHAAQRKRKTKATMSRFRNWKAPINQGFLTAPQQVGDIYILYPSKRRPKA